MSAIDIHIPTIPPQHFGNAEVTAEWVSVNMIDGINAGKASRTEGRTMAWSRYVAAMHLNPKMDAKDFYKIFDSTWDFMHRPDDVIPKPKPKPKGSPKWVKVESVEMVMRVNPQDRNDNSIYFSVNKDIGRKYVVKGEMADDIKDFYDLRMMGGGRREIISGQLNQLAQTAIDKITGKASTPKIAAPKPATKPPRTPAPSVPAILAPAPAAPSDMASVPVRLGGGGIAPIPGVEPPALAPAVKRRQPAAKPAAKPKAKKAAAPKPKSKPKKTAAAKPAKAKNGKTAPELTAAQRKRLAATGSVTVKRGGKFVTVTR